VQFKKRRTFSHIFRGSLLLNLINSIYGILKAKYYPDISKEEGLDMRA
jgi:hypothetical protein